MDTLDWEDIWNRLKGMLWSAGSLGGAGLTIGLLFYGLEMHLAHQGWPGFYQDFYRPNLLQEGIRILAGWIYASPFATFLVHIGWLIVVLRIFLAPELPPTRRWYPVLAGAAGLLAGGFLDAWLTGWGEASLWVRFGVLSGGCAFLGTALALRERAGLLLGRTVRGGLAGALVGLGCAFGAQIEIVGYAAGFSPAARTVLTPAVCGAVIGLAFRGGEILFAGDAARQWRRFWPLIGLTLVVLINAVGPVLLVQYWYSTGRL